MFQTPPTTPRHHEAVGTESPLKGLDPLSSPDLLFPVPTGSSPLFQLTSNDVKLLIRPEKDEDQIEAREALIALFFAVSQS